MGKKNGRKDCYQRVPAETSRTEPPPDSFAIEVSKTCGSTTGKWSKCPKGNTKVKIGKKIKKWDWGQPTWEDTVATSCGLKCLASSECGGFNYNKRQGKCYYRKNAQCGRPQRKNKNNDCWVKTIAKDKGKEKGKVKERERKGKGKGKGTEKKKGIGKEGQGKGKGKEKEKGKEGEKGKEKERERKGKGKGKGKGKEKGTGNEGEGKR